MNQIPVVRTTLSTLALSDADSFATVEVRRITMAPSVHPGPHWHNGPVFGVIESGSVYFAAGEGEERVLRSGDTFYEPADETITRFDATEEGVTFLAWFPTPAHVDPELTMGERVV